MKYQSVNNNNGRSTGIKKNRETKSRLSLVLHLISRENGASFPDQSRSKLIKTKESPITFDTQSKIAPRGIHTTLPRTPDVN